MENNKWIGLLYLIILKQMDTSTAFDETEEHLKSKSEESPLVEVRAVFINCETKRSESVAPDSDLVRFEREELFKHSYLRDCNKKLAVTVKISCEPDAGWRSQYGCYKCTENAAAHSLVCPLVDSYDTNGKTWAVEILYARHHTSSGDEYLPIEHVLEGPEKKRVRLLDPYILRLRRETPLQAYKLRRIDTVSGILVDSSGKTYAVGLNKQNRIERDIERSETETPDDEVFFLQTSPVTDQAIHPAFIKVASHPSGRYVQNYMCTNSTLCKRKKRSEHNIVVEEASDDGKQWDSKEQYYRISDAVKLSDMNRDLISEADINVNSHHPHHRAANVDHTKGSTELSGTKPLTDEITKPDERSRLKKLRHLRIPYSKEKESRAGRKRNTCKNKTTKEESLKTRNRKSHSSVSKRLDDHYENNDSYENGENYDNKDVRMINNTNIKPPAREFAVYEIGHPELWYTVHVQLFEKLSTAEGKTVWNDLTKGEEASISSKKPEWTGPDMNVRYRPAEWIPREEFSLPSSSLCLLAPIRGAYSLSYSDKIRNLNGISEDGGYIVLPEEDVMGLKDEDSIIIKRTNNNTDSEFSSKSEEHNEQGPRRVVVRISRALLTGNENKVNIANLGSEKYLTMPHRHPLHAQIDLEARADENELVRVGATGRIAIAVADSTRRTRTILTLQVGNTGLAAARFRVMTRDCGPALANLLNDKKKYSMMAGPVLIPPRHIKSLRLELPFEIPVDIAHCSVSLMNDDEKSVAVREVAIKKGDRCFCVWHCECVCLSDDPKLLCREMAESRQSAAGLSSRERTRHARSACYKDVVYLNLFVIATGVILALLALGLLKAILGQIFSRIGTWGLDRLVQWPRKLDEYKEPQLKGRNVECDCDGWPIHPDTKQRTVRVFSRSIEFALNVIFFVAVPCMVVYDVIKQLYARFRKLKTDESFPLANNNIKKCFSTQDMQAVALRYRRRRSGLRKWMTPQAQELSKELWEKGLLPSASMRPLLREGRPAEPHGPDTAECDAPDSCADSEQDDTEYVITQMQKSRESLTMLKQKSKP